MKKGFMSVSYAKRPICHPELVSGSKMRELSLLSKRLQPISFLFGAYKKQRNGLHPKKRKICGSVMFANYISKLTHAQQLGTFLLNQKSTSNSFASNRSLTNIVCWFDVVKHRFANIRNGGRVKGFTLAEVLITLAIIGVVAALTIPAVVKNYQETQFKTAYKKAFSDMNRAFSEAIAFSEFPQRENNCYDVNFANFVRDTMKENFKVMKDCPQGHALECWVQGDTVGGTYSRPSGEASAFVDASGRVWAEYEISRSIILVDTNGSKPPNKFGKDRQQFAFFNKGGNDDCTITPSIPVQIRSYHFNDYLTEHDWCKFPPCYYKSWLMK